jgi:hypothetical protein
MYCCPGFDKAVQGSIAAVQRAPQLAGHSGLQKLVSSLSLLMMFA